MHLPISRHDFHDALQWRHSDHDGVSNHQPHGCVYSTVYSGADQREHQSSVPLVYVRGIHRWPVNSPHKGPVTRKISPYDDVIMARHNPLFTDCVLVQAEYWLMLAADRFNAVSVMACLQIMHWSQRVIQILHMSYTLSLIIVLRPQWIDVSTRKDKSKVKFYNNVQQPFSHWIQSHYDN